MRGRRSAIVRKDLAFEPRERHRFPTLPAHEGTARRRPLQKGTAKTGYGLDPFDPQIAPRCEHAVVLGDEVVSEAYEIQKISRGSLNPRTRTSGRLWNVTPSAPDAACVDHFSPRSARASAAATRGPSCCRARSRSSAPPIGCVRRARCDWPSSLGHYDHPTGSFRARS